MQLVSKTPTIVNTTLTSADTEYSFTLPIGTKKFTMQCRTDDEVKFSFTKGESGTNYMTIYEGASHSEENLNTNGVGLTIYLQSPNDNVVVECLYWRTD